MKCLRCQEDNLENSYFCTTCGAPLPVKCLHCGTVNLPDANYCGRCGTPASATAATMPASSGQSTDDFVPAAERRHLTILFCDIVGSTSLAASLELEDLNVITKGYYKTCEHAIRQVGGYLSNKFGDGVQALFGYPHAHEDDAERAVRAALAIIRTIGASNSTNKARLDVRVGIASGHVLVPLSEVQTLVGLTPNRAAHLQAAAEPNSILIADETRQLLTETFALQKSKRELKGEPEPVMVWRVIGEKNVASRFAAHVVNLTDFVGRDQEVALLASRWQQSIEGEGQVVLLSGEAGIGKSRIV
jgi:class 3 adenylate cyclase